MSKLEDEIRKINEKGEMDPDKHDGSYELMRATIDTYAQMEDRSNLDFNDLNLIYSMSIGTWKISVSSKKKYITRSNLPEDLKTVLEEKLDMIWEKAKARKYENEEESPSIGIIGGKPVFSKDIPKDNELIQKFIDMCVEIRNKSDEEDIFESCSKVLNKKFKVNGMRAAKASGILHCLKPTVFPILNSNMEKGSVDEYFDIKLDKKDSIQTYIDNCRKIKKIRDDNFEVKNYRIFDIAARQFEKNENTNTCIGYLKILKFLEENGGMEYSDLKNKEEQERLSNDGTNAANELKKFCKEKLERFRLNNEPIHWQNGKNIRKYLWAQLKKNEYKKSPISISIFAEKPEKTKSARFRVSLEINNGKSEDRDWIDYYKHLDKKISKDSSLVYVSGSDELGNIEDLGKILKEKDKVDAISSISDKNKRNENKIQICKIIECNDKTTDDDIETEILDGIQELIPYYEHVFGYEFDKNMIFYGPPGTGKTYNTVKYAVAIIEEKSIDKINEEIKNKGYKEILERYNNHKHEGKIEFITFHQSYGYEEFIEGIKPKIKEEDKQSEKDEQPEENKQLHEDEKKEEDGKIEYTIKSGIFKEFCENAEKDDKPYVFIIDEINRGNISKIFGELITLIEEDKRTDKNDKNVGLRVKLPYMKENEKPFGVPNNVYIIGTMNTADRSIALMDTALRRRFHFIEMMPDSKVVDKIIIRKDGKELDIAKMLDVMNKRIECLYDREHTIGHAFFIELANEPTIQKLGNIFQKSIIPLLQEYFYEDYNKIMLILGDDGKDEKHKFIKKTENEPSSIFKGDISMYDFPEYSYEINTDKDEDGKTVFEHIESYIGIIGEENKDENESEEEEK